MKKQQSNFGELWDIKKAAWYLSISETWLYVNREKYKIPFIKIGGALRFRKEDLDDWMEKKRIA